MSTIKRRTKRIMSPVLSDAQQMHRENPDTFSVPSDEWIAKVGRGSHVKVCMTNGNNGERFWVKITKREGSIMIGSNCNSLVLFQKPKPGDLIRFHTDNIYDIK